MQFRTSDDQSLSIPARLVNDSPGGRLKFRLRRMSAVPSPNISQCMAQAPHNRELPRDANYESRQGHGENVIGTRPQFLNCLPMEVLVPRPGPLSQCFEHET